MLSGEARDPLRVLGGTGLRVYMYMLRRSRPVGVREVQRALGFRSPSTARHHLERLVELGLAERTSEGYRAKPPRSGLLTLYIQARGRVVPRLVGLASASTAGLLAYVLLGGADPVALLIMAVVTILLWREVYCMARILRSLLE